MPPHNNSTTKFTKAPSLAHRLGACLSTTSLPRLEFGSGFGDGTVDLIDHPEEGIDEAAKVFESGTGTECGMKYGEVLLGGIKKDLVVVAPGVDVLLAELLFVVDGVVVGGFGEVAFACKVVGENGFGEVGGVDGGGNVLEKRVPTRWTKDGTLENLVGKWLWTGGGTGD